MKKTLKALALCASIALVLTGCKASPDEEKVEAVKKTAPSVGTAADLAATGGKVPDTKEEAVALFSESVSVLNSLMNANSGMKSVLADTEEGDDEEDFGTKERVIDVDTAIGEGHATFKGKITVTTDGMKGQPDTIEANKKYDISSTVASGTIDGTVTNVKCSSGGKSYILNCKSKNELNQSYAFSCQTGKDTNPQTLSDAVFTATMGYTLGYGNAFSVKRESDGAGAKFLITYLVEYGPKSWTFSNAEQRNSDEKTKTEFQDFLKTQKATLTVFNDDNKAVYTIDLTGDEAVKYTMIRLGY